MYNKYIKYMTAALYNRCLDERKCFDMANRMILNETSYFGAGAISEIVTEAKSALLKRRW